MNTMTIDTSLADRILTQLAQGRALSAAVLAQSLDTSVSSVRFALARASSHGDVTSKLVGGNGRRVRVFAITARWALRQQAELEWRSQEGTKQEIEDSTRVELRSMVRFLGGVCRVKDKHSTLVANVLKLRTDLFPKCSCGEPVDTAGETCCFCAPAPELKVVIRSVGLRKPGVDLSVTFTPESLASVIAVVNGAPSARAAQRDAANWLADRNDGFIDAEVLRSVLRFADRLSAPNFTVNMKKDGFEAVRNGRTLRGWKV